MPHRVCPQTVYLGSELFLALAERESAFREDGGYSALPFGDTQQVFHFTVFTESHHSQPVLLVFQLLGYLLLVGFEHVFLQRQRIKLAGMVQPHSICPHQQVGIDIGCLVVAGDVVEQVMLAPIAFVVAFHFPAADEHFVCIAHHRAGRDAQRVDGSIGIPLLEFLLRNRLAGVFRSAAHFLGSGAQETGENEERKKAEVSHDENCEGVLFCAVFQQ